MEDHAVDVDEAVCLLCRRIVQAMVKEYDWALIPQDDLIERVLDATLLPGSPVDAVDARCIERQAKRQYTMILYEACRQENDLNRREQGYAELSRFLFRVAYNRWPELAEDAMQRALLLVYEQIDRCQSPDTFLKFAFYKLRQAITDEARSRQKDQRGDETFLPVESSQTTPIAHLEEQECRQLLLEAVMSLPKEPERQVILLKFFGGLSDMEIGERLGITTGNVRVLRHRGLARLQKDGRLQAMWGNR